MLHLIIIKHCYFSLFSSKLSEKSDTFRLLKAALFWRQHTLKPNSKQFLGKFSEEFEACLDLPKNQFKLSSISLFEQ